MANSRWVELRKIDSKPETEWRIDLHEPKREHLSAQLVLLDEVDVSLWIGYEQNARNSGAYRCALMDEFDIVEALW